MKVFRKTKKGEKERNLKSGRNLHKRGRMDKKIRVAVKFGATPSENDLIVVSTGTSAFLQLLGWELHLVRFRGNMEYTLSLYFT